MRRETLFFCTKIYKCFDPFFNFFFDRYKQLVRCAVQTSVDQIAFSFDDNFYNRGIAITRRYDEIGTNYLVSHYEIFIAARSIRVILS